MDSQRLIVGISGASAAIYGIRALELLRLVPQIETHLVCTRTAQSTIFLETGYRLDQVHALAHASYSWDDMSAAISSGSFRTRGMLVAPCSMNTMACITGCITKDLLTRAADVTLKERRPLVLMIRESPLHLGHLRRLVQVAEMGAVIAPPIPSFYHQPSSLDDVICHSVGRVLELFDIEIPTLKRWRDQA